MKAPTPVYLVLEEPCLCDNNDNKVPSSHSEVPGCLEDGLHGDRGLQGQEEAGDTAQLSISSHTHAHHQSSSNPTNQPDIVCLCF